MVRDRAYDMRTDIRQYRRALQEANRVLESRQRDGHGDWSPFMITIFAAFLALWIAGTLMY